MVFEPWLQLGDHSPLLDVTEVSGAGLRLHLTVAFARLQEASFELLDVTEAVERFVVAFL